MAALEPSDRCERIFLKNSNIEISGVRCEMEQKYKLATLVIGRFYLLKNEIEYVAPILHIAGELHFIKKRTSLVIKIRTTDVGKLSVSVLYEKIKTSKPVLAQQFAKGEYKVVIPYSTIEDTQNMYLKEGRLLIHFKFQESKKILKRVHACRGREKSVEERISDDLKFMTVYPHCTDIILHVEKQKFRVPRGLLAARSEYLKEYPDTEDNIYLSTYYEAVYCAVKYLYTGKIPNVDDLNEQEICRIMEVAKSLKIRSLESKCVSYINQLIIQGDVETSGEVNDQCVTS